MPKEERLPPFAEKHHVDGFEHHAPIQKQRKMPDVIEVEAQLFDRVLQALAVRIIDLRPAGDPGLHEVAQVIIRNLLLVDLRTLDPLGARADETHFTAENVPELR